VNASKIGGKILMVLGNGWRYFILVEICPNNSVNNVVDGVIAKVRHFY